MQFRTILSRSLASPCFVLVVLTLLWPPAGRAQTTNPEVSDSPQSFRAPYLPVRASEVLQDVPSASDPRVKRMRELKNSLASQPQDLETAVKLSNAYVDFGRQIGDAHYAGYAEAVITPWLKAKSPPVAVMVADAVILQYQHQFDAARVELRRALALDPREQQAWLTLAFIEMTQGNYEEAQKDCQRVGNLANLSTGVVCFATVRSFVGDAQRAQQILASIGGTLAKADATTAAWILGLQAEIAGRLGDRQNEETFYRKALQFTPDDDFLLVAFADFLLDQNRPKEVLDLLARQTQSDSAFLRIALAYQELNSPLLSRYTWIMSARFEALTLRGSALYDRERSRFVLHLLHDPDTALELALGDWKLQRAPLDLRVVFEAALAAHKPQAAQDALAFVDRTHLQDPFIESLSAQLRAQPLSSSTR